MMIPFLSCVRIVNWKINLPLWYDVYSLQKKSHKWIFLISLSRVICFKISIETVYFLKTEFFLMIFGLKATVFLVSFSSNRCTNKVCIVYIHQEKKKSFGVLNLFHRLHYVIGKGSEEMWTSRSTFFHHLKHFCFSVTTGGW